MKQFKVFEISVDKTTPIKNKLESELSKWTEHKNEIEILCMTQSQTITKDKIHFVLTVWYSKPRTVQVVDIFSKESQNSEKE